MPPALRRGVSRSPATKKAAQLSQMPRPCAVEFHARGYEESRSTLPDATGLAPWSFTLAATKKAAQLSQMPPALRRGVSRSRLRRKPLNSPRCHRPCAVEFHAPAYEES